MSTRVRPYFLFGLSGVISGVAANGVLLGWRVPTGVLQRLDSLEFVARTVAGFTAEQSFGLSAHFVKSFGATAAPYSGGTSLVAAGAEAYFNPEVPLSSSYAYASPGGMAAGQVAMLATTAALTTAGVHVVAAQPFAWDAFTELAAGATVSRGFLEGKYAPPEGQGQLMRADSGFCVRVPTAMAAGGTARLFVRVRVTERAA